MQGKTGGNTEEGDHKSQFIELYTLLKIKGQAENNEIMYDWKNRLKGEIQYRVMAQNNLTCTLANL